MTIVALHHIQDENINFFILNAFLKAQPRIFAQPLEKRFKWCYFHKEIELKGLIKSGCEAKKSARKCILKQTEEHTHIQAQAHEAHLIYC